MALRFKMAFCWKLWLQNSNCGRASPSRDLVMMNQHSCKQTRSFQCFSSTIFLVSDNYKSISGYFASPNQQNLCYCIIFFGHSIFSFSPNAPQEQWTNGGALVAVGKVAAARFAMTQVGSRHSMIMKSKVYVLPPFHPWRFLGGTVCLFPHFKFFIVLRIKVGSPIFWKIKIT